MKEYIMSNPLKKITQSVFSIEVLPYWIILLIDCGIVALVGYVTCAIEAGMLQFALSFWKITLGVFFSEVIFGLFFKIFHTYRGIIRFSSFVDLIRIALCNICAAVAVLFVFRFLKWIGFTFIYHMQFQYLVVYTGFITLLMWIVRISVKDLYERYRINGESDRVIIYGDKAGAVSIAKSLKVQSEMKYVLCGFISPDDHPNVSYLMGEKVYEDNDAIFERLEELKVRIVIVSPLQVEHFREREALVDYLTSHGIKIMMMHLTEEWDGKSELNHEMLHEVEIEDLLPRERIQVNMEEIGNLLKDRSILITGAAGSIGSEMVRQIVAFHPSEMILIDQAETPMHDIRLMMARDYPYIKSETIVASITNSEYMEDLFRKYRPEYVFHAAAYKHVPMMEDNPAIAVQNNIVGTRIIADLAVKYGTKKFVMISTDKAVNPTNIMGCSKRICEIYCQSLNNAIASGRIQGNTQFVTTRFGNVLGSNGSVIPLFKEQLKAGGPLTVTDPNIIRFFMLIPEACKLVLEAGTMGNGGEIFVFDMGKPVKIVDLAKRMIALSGAKNVQIKFSGLREGEKLYEEVLSDKEKTKPTPHPKIMVAEVREYDYEMALKNEEHLFEVSKRNDPMEIVKVMKEIVPEYKSENSVYEALDKIEA